MYPPKTQISSAIWSVTGHGPLELEPQALNPFATDLMRLIYRRLNAPEPQGGA